MSISHYRHSKTYEIGEVTLKIKIPEEKCDIRFMCELPTCEYYESEVGELLCIYGFTGIFEVTKTGKVLARFCKHPEHNALRALEEV